MSMKLTKAVSGLARSGATRSGWPVLQGHKIPLFALSKVARAGATRSNYHSTRTFITINGVPYGTNAPHGAGILAASLTKSDAINQTPTTVAFTAYGWVPVEGSDIIITLGSLNNLRREFAGTILRTTHRYAEKPVAQNMLYDVQGIDWLWGLNRRKVSGDYKSGTVAAIAAALMTFAPSGYTLHVDADIGAEQIDEITFTETTLSAAFAQLATRVGGDFRCDYLKVVKLFYEDTTITTPTAINRAPNTTFTNLTWTRDLSQVITRCLGEFGGCNALEQVGPGETLIPVETAGWYLSTGGVILSGQQRITYGGLIAGGGGSVVGPGAAPSGAPNVALLTGAGIEVGAHDYAVTFKTAVGESITGPRVSISVGLVPSPATAPTAGTPTAGAGPDPGYHDYAVTFVTASGETTPGPRLTAVTALTAPPTTAPTPNVGAVGAGPDAGTHDYAILFQTATGLTPTGPISGQIAIANTPIAQPPTAPTVNPAISGGAVTLGSHYYAVSFVTALGETPVAGAPQGVALPATQVADPTSPPGHTDGSGTNNVTGGWLYYSYAYRTGSGETLQSPTVEIMATLVPGPPYNFYRNVAVTAYPSSDPAVTSIVFYRAFGAGIQKRQWATSGNVQSTFTDDCSNLSGPLAPTGGNNTVTAGPKQTIPLTNIPTGPSGTTGRKLWRTFANASGPYYLLATITNNSSTTYNDSAPDAVAAQPPTSNTAYVSTAVHLTGIPIGTAEVTARQIYRRSGGQGLRGVATIPNNSATTYDDTVPNASLGVAPPTTNTAYVQQIPLANIPLGPALVTARKLYRSVANVLGAALKLLATLNDNTTTTFTDTVADSGLGAAPPSVNTATAQQVQLSAIPLGAAAVTARVIYRTKAGQTLLQKLTTINDNTTATIVDAAADATLTTIPPASDTSGLQQPSGNVLAGSIVLPVATVASFLTTGGWATVGSLNIRYTGISGSNLIGIPATGPGSISATITFNTTAFAAPMLIKIPASGVGAIKYPILRGDPVNLFVQVDDLDAQAAVRAQIPGSDGIIEDEIQDRRLSYTEGLARCRARLELLAARDSSGKVGIIAVTYSCRDINSIAGATVPINIGPPINLIGDFLIQRVSAAQYYVPHLNPTYTVEASSLRFSADELLRQLQKGAL